MPEKFAIYKPNKALRGAAVQFDFNPEKQSVFVEAAPQSAERAFDWNVKVIAKLNMMELCKLLLVFEDKLPTVKLFHDSTKSPGETTLKNTVVEVTRGDFGFFMKISSQGAQGLRTVNVTIAEEEAKALTILFRRAVGRAYGW
ncbi:hypothetical protein HY994_02635 [Candidatus Micrarchaeota archaeon]|nr:hypothetical protein [Candidatus Micrarchaeota archaeon]